MKDFQNIDLKMVGERIRNARKKLNLTQEKAAERASISSGLWSHLELGNQRAGLRAYWQIAAALDLTLDDIFLDDVTSARLHKAFSEEGILDACTALEKAIISEMMFALKEILERNLKG